MSNTTQQWTDSPKTILSTAKLDLHECLPEWFNTNSKSISEGISRLLSHEPELELLLNDATRHGRKLRSSVAMQLLNWADWEILDRNKASLIDDLARIEVLHSASCIIDDIIDGDQIRRGMPAFYVRNGLPQALLTSLLMVVTAFRGTTPRSDDPILQDLISKTRETILGEAYDSFLFSIEDPKNENNSIDRYLRKTTPCFELAFGLVAKWAGRSESECTAASRFGHVVGSFYQSANDHYDWFSIDPTKRGRVDEPVLVTFGIPLAFLFRMDSSLKGIVGKTVPRSKIFDLIQVMKEEGIHRKSRQFLDDIKIKLLSCYPAGTPPLELQAFVGQVDSEYFWSYSYES